MDSIIIKKAQRTIELPRSYVGKDLKINIFEANENDKRKSEIKEMAKDADFLTEIDEISDDFKYINSEGI